MWSDNEKWEEHPDMMRWVADMRDFTEFSNFDEDVVYNIIDKFEDGKYEYLHEHLEELRDAVQNLYFALDHACDYIEELKKTQKLVKYTFEKINGDGDEFDFTISKDGEVLYTIHYNFEKDTVSEHPHFYALNEYNKNKFNKAFRLMLMMKYNKMELDFYEKV